MDKPREWKEVREITMNCGFFKGSVERFSDPIHVIEYSAYLDLQEMVKELEKKLYPEHAVDPMGYSIKGPFKSEYENLKEKHKALQETLSRVLDKSMEPDPVLMSLVYRLRERVTTLTVKADAMALSLEILLEQKIIDQCGGLEAYTEYKKKMAEDKGAWG